MKDRIATIALLLIAACVLPAARASAQVDQLLFLKQPPAPNVIVVVDTSSRMQYDAAGTYYDMAVYSKSSSSWHGTLGVTSANTNRTYRRKYLTLAAISGMSEKFSASTISIVGDLQTTAYATFDYKTRYGVARLALAQAILRNNAVARFGLLKTRQSTPQMPGTLDADGPVRVSDTNERTPTNLGSDYMWGITKPTVTTSNAAAAASTAKVVQADASGANASVLGWLTKQAGQSGSLVPAGQDGAGTVDAPVAYMLDDARTEAARLIAADADGCRNTAVVLVVGGADGASTDMAARASTFLNVSGRRVPIYVIGIAPSATDRTKLQAVAANSGGVYTEITREDIDAAPSTGIVHAFERAVNFAVQHTFAKPADFNTAPTVALPTGPFSEYQMTTPIVGTVNLKGVTDLNGVPLPDSETDLTSKSGAPLPQHANVLLTTGMALPGATARLRAHRLYKPVADSAQLTGYKFVSDGRPLWVASAPDAASRNIYTCLPNGDMLAFTTDNRDTLTPYLNTSNPEALIAYIRSQPLGAVIGSTPAFEDPPSLDPPPDSSYPAFLNAHKSRRTLIFVGANDGMLHAIDARLGTEVWAFIPFNLLPKLKALMEGQALDDFQYFVDGSPKVADVKIDGAWKTYLFIGQGAGGTFYQAFDITLSTLVDVSDADVLSHFTGTSRIQIKWAFPDYTHFDYAATPYGELGAGATTEEKTVGETWSDPAVGQIESSTSPYVVLVGSGFLRRTVQNARGASSAGTSFYLLSAESGTLLDSRDVGNDGKAENVDSCGAAKDCTQIKNALQTDPVATGPANSRFISTVYMGDLDGRLWRFGLGLTSGAPTIKSGPTKLADLGSANPIFSSLASVNVGGTQQYVFFGTGSDSLPYVYSGTAPKYGLYGVLDPPSGTTTCDGTGTGCAFKRELAMTTTGGKKGEPVVTSAIEQVSAFPAVAGDIVFFTTTTTFPATPCAAPDTNIYALTFIGGAAYDTNGDNVVKSTESPKITLTGAGRATAPFIIDQHLVLAAGGKVQLFGDPNDFNNGVGQVGVRILSWREVR